jgi:replicative DNA helicase
MDFNKVPPHDIEAEQAVIGSMLTDKEAVISAIESLSADDFYREDNKIIYQAILNLYNKGDAIDIITLKSELSSMGKLEAVGGLEYLAELPEKVPTTANVDRYINIIEEKSTLRTLIKTGNEIITLGYDPTQDVEGIDAACKTVILANSLLGIDATYSDVKVEGISNINSQAIELAKKDDYLIKLIAEVSPDNLQVSPRLVKRGSSYDVSGTLNMATIKTDLADEVSVIGLGAGSLETASAMLTDLISILNKKY